MKNKKQINEDLHNIKTNVINTLHSPKLLGTAVLIGFLCTFKGKHKQHAFSFAKKHVLKHYAQLPLISGALQFLPLVLTFFKRKKELRK